MINAEQAIYNEGFRKVERVSENFYTGYRNGIKYDFMVCEEEYEYIDIQVKVAGKDEWLYAFEAIPPEGWYRK